jgi:hypothetical protein
MISEVFIAYKHMLNMRLLTSSNADAEIHVKFIYIYIYRERDCRIDYVHVMDEHMVYDLWFICSDIQQYIYI